MEKIYQLKKQRDIYYNLKEYLQIMVRHLNSSIESLNVSNQKMKENYVIDGLAADNNKIFYSIQTLEEERNRVLYTVIPSIEKELNNLRWRIQQAELELTEL